MVAYAKPFVRTQALFVDGVEVTASAAELNTMDGITATAAELNKVADLSGNTLELTASDAIPAGVQHIELNHATVAVAATIANFADHHGLFTIKDTSASGTAAHTVTLTLGSFDGTHDTATFNAPEDFVMIYVDATGSGTIATNVGTVIFS